MDHVAIMRRSWNLLPKILDGRKRIESRWYMAKFAPWDRIKPGDTVYFRDAGKPVTLKADVENVLQYKNPDKDTIQDIITKYGGSGGICFRLPESEVLEWAKDKRYCILIFLKNAQAISPFMINKKGFGNACAWMCVDDMNRIIIREM
jgi:hypothetical protein